MALTDTDRPAVWTQPDSETDLLRPPGSPTSLPAYVRATLAMWSFAVVSARGRMRSRTADRILGGLWLVLEPLIRIGIYGLLFGLLLDADRGVENYLAYLSIGYLAYLHHARGIGAGMMSLSSNARLLNGFSIPRAVLPLSAAIGAFLAALPALGLMIAVMVFSGVPPTLAIVAIPALLVGQFLMNLGTGLVLSPVVLRVPDVGAFINALFRLQIYAAAVLFSPAAVLLPFERGELFVRLAALNPVYDYVQLYRWVLLGVRPVATSWVVISAILWPLVSTLVGLMIHVRLDARLSADRVARSVAR